MFFALFPFPIPSGHKCLLSLEGRGRAGPRGSWGHLHGWGPVGLVCGRPADLRSSVNAFSTQLARTGPSLPFRQSRTGERGGPTRNAK